ncbi:MAG TPA: MBL fold metallo-hydrolase [Candidatus Acidoferrum sp.]|nr:MBL fold metallo-hydrolase [Candidatus Acidoferrum sp.]
MQATIAAKPRTKLFEHVSPYVSRISHLIVNSYLIEDPASQRWVLIDAGLKTSTSHIIHAAEERFGADARPEAIILTHGHFDHVGALAGLIERWKVPVYAHRLEMPYLTGRAKYPPPDPTVGGGMMAVMSRFFTRGPISITGHVRALPDNGDVPGLMPNWRWLATPGHSPGHISLYDAHEGLLVAGDAFVTTKQGSATAVLMQRQHVNGPPAYFTPDWRSARDSVRELATLEPEIAATGHGIPMRGEVLKRQLQTLAKNFERSAMPRRGRYVRRPAVTDEHGVISVPPPVPDPLPKVAAVVFGVVALSAFGLLIRSSDRKRRAVRSRSASANQRALTTR